MSEQRQIDLEVLSVQRGLDRYKADLANKRASDKEFDGAPANKFVLEVMEKFIPRVTKFRSEAGRKMVRGMTTGRPGRRRCPVANCGRSRSRIMTRQP